MYPAVKYQCDISSLIRDQSIVTYFQPIVSVIKKKMVGVEGLSRGIQGIEGLIPPDIMFNRALENDLVIDLDRLCRDKALEAFQLIQFCNKDLLLFLNMDASILDRVVGSKYLLQEINKRNLLNHNIVIEINEMKVNNLQSLKDFIDTYREYGFLIALDDVGSGFSNLDRIPLTRPDIIKIDKGIITGIDKHYFKQEVFKSLGSLSKNIGALVVAEGIETEEEALICLELGADLLQGYYFARPMPASATLTDHCNTQINQIAACFREYINKKNRNERFKLTHYDMLIQNVCKQLSLVSFSEYNRKLYEIIECNGFIECLYVLDQSGVQLSDTVCRMELGVHRSSIFQPAQKGENHSLKSYYYSLVNLGLRKFITSPYISMATGKLCMTISAMFKDNNHHDLVCCMDFDPNSLTF